MPAELGFLSGVTPQRTTFRLYHDPSDDWVHLALSDILVLSESSFSSAAAAFSYEHAVILSPPNKELLYDLAKFSEKSVASQYRPRPDLIFLSARGHLVSPDDAVMFRHRIDHLRRASRNPNFRSFSFG